MTCADEPKAPNPASADADALVAYIKALAAAGQDCRDKVRAVRP